MPLNSVPATTTLRGLEAKRRTGADRRRRSAVLGRRRARQRRRARRAGVGRRARLQVFPLAVRRRRVSPPSSSRPAACAAGPRAAATCRCSCTRSGRPALRPPPLTARSARLRHVARLAAAVAEVDAIAMLIALCPRVRRARPHRPPRRRRGAAAAARRARRRAADHRRDLPALPDVLPPRRSPTARRCSSARRRSAAAPTARRCGGRSVDGDIDLVATDHSPCPPAMKAGRRLPARVGRHRRRSSSACRRCGPARPRAACRSSALPSGCAPRRRGWPGSPAARDRSRPARTPTSSIWDPDAEFVVDETRAAQRHKRTPYAGRTLRGRVIATYARGRVVYRDSGV